MELACGTGIWTEQLLRHAAEITTVDASPEMLGIASRRVESDRVRFVLADIFNWEPDRRYDVVFFGFWLSHVPLERFDAFWAPVAQCLSRRAACSSSTTPTAPQTSSWRVSRPRPSAGACMTGPPTAP